MEEFKDNTRHCKNHTACLRTMVIFRVTEASTSTDPPATSTAHRVKANTASATSAVSPTLRGTEKCLKTQTISM